MLAREGPQVVHFHNTFPLISPAAYYAARAANVPVVQSLHNYRLLCANATFYRNGHVCEDCLGAFAPWRGVAHACYRDSRAASSVVAAMLAFHRARGTWVDLVDAYIVALTADACDKFVRGGLPAERLITKPNVVYPDPGQGPGLGGYALFAGRLVAEKGVATLLSAWQHLADPPPLKIAGAGPMADAVTKVASRCRAIEWLGEVSNARVEALMKDAHVLVVPSVWYEGLPRVIAEAFAVGLPVIASDLGAMSSLIEHQHNGLHFRPGDAADLADQVRWAFTHRAELLVMRDAEAGAHRNHPLVHARLCVGRGIEGGRSGNAADTRAQVVGVF